MASAQPIEWRCQKWADCSCAKTGDCGCGDSCGCGNISVEDVKKAMETQCPLADCKCSDCKCQSCACGTTQRTIDQWIDFVRARKEAEAAGDSPKSADDIPAEGEAPAVTVEAEAGTES